VREGRGVWMRCEGLKLILPSKEGGEGYSCIVWGGTKKNRKKRIELVLTDSRRTQPLQYRPHLGYWSRRVGNGHLEVINYIVIINN